MSANSKIEWTDHTFNPWWGCTKVSAGCANCYAEGISTEDQKTFNDRWHHLQDFSYDYHPAVIFLSCEPLLGPIHLPESFLNCEGSKWVIAGGESGRKARPMHGYWPRSLRGQCAIMGIPFFFKQWGEWSPCSWIGLGSCPECGEEHGRVGLDEPMIRVGKKNAGRQLDGELHNAFPEIK